MTSELEDSKFVIANSMTSWQAAFNMWLKDEGEFDKNLIEESKSRHCFKFQTLLYVKIKVS